MTEPIPTYRVTLEPNPGYPDAWIARFIEPCPCGRKHEHGVSANTHGHTEPRMAHCGHRTNARGYYIEVHNPPE